MISRAGKPFFELKQWHETRITLEVRHPQQSLRKDIIETVTGLSNSAITAGGKIAAETVVYSGESTPGEVTAGLVFSSLSLAANTIDFVMIPLGYLYKLYSREKVPFNLSNNTKWFLAGVTLTLAIISFAVAAAARVISFISVGISLATAAFSFAKYFYDRRILSNKVKSKNEKIEALCMAIQNDMALMNRYQDCLQSVKMDEQVVKGEAESLLVGLDEVVALHESHCEKLKKVYNDKQLLERALVRQGSPVELVSNALKVVFAGAVLAGTILSLNPLTLPIGMPIIAAAALMGLTALIVKKIIEVVQKRLERKRGLKDDALVSIEINSTATIIKSCPLNAVTEMPVTEVEREAKKVADKPAETSLPFLSDDEDDEDDEPSSRAMPSVASARR